MYDLTMELQADSEKCLYEQIYEYIREEIRGGKLQTKERLPSTRMLAQHLQVSRTTVDFAYAQLQSEGYIEARPYQGYFVCPVEAFLPVEEQPPKELKGETIASGLETKKEVTSNIGWDFNPNGIDMSSFPFGVWQRITKQVLSYDNQDLFALGKPQGDLDLRETIGKYLHSARGVNCSPNQIVVGAGNDYLLMLLEKILGRHRTIAMENPSYKKAYDSFQSFAYDIISVGMDENGMKVEELEKTNAQLAYVMPSHQYPTGAVMPIGRRLELLRWAGEGANRYLIEDDYDSEFRYKGKPIPSLQASDRMEKVIYLGTFSKAIAPAIRVSYMVLPKPLLEVYEKNFSFFSSTVSRIDQRILNEFISQGYFERYLNKARKNYKEKHDALLEELRPFGDSFHLSGEHAGLHVLLTSKQGISDQELTRLAKQVGVKVYALSGAYLGGNGPRKPSSTVILGYGGMMPEEIHEGIAQLKKAWLGE